MIEVSIDASRSMESAAISNIANVIYASSAVLSEDAKRDARVID